MFPLRYIILLLAVAFASTAKGQVSLLKYAELEQRMAKGKDTTYVVNFWATWCAPCVEELPFFEQLSKSSKGKPVKVILMSLDFRSKLNSEVIPFVKKNKLSAEVFVVNEPDQQAFIEKVSPKWSGALPATLFVHKAKGVKLFHEKQFTYAELQEVLATIN